LPCDPFAIVGAKSLEFLYYYKTCVLLVGTYKDDKFERFDPDVDPFQRNKV